MTRLRICFKQIKELFKFQTLWTVDKNVLKIKQNEEIWDNDDFVRIYICETQEEVLQDVFHGAV